jgi:hypothetical protein
MEGFFDPPPPKRSGTVSVRLTHAGRSVPIPEDHPDLEIYLQMFKTETMGANFDGSQRATADNAARKVISKILADCEPPEPRGFEMTGGDEELLQA